RSRSRSSRSPSGSSASRARRCRRLDIAGSPRSAPDRRKSGKASEPARRIPRVQVIVLGIDPGVANTGFGIVAHDRGRLVALDGGVIETPAGTDAGARLAEIHRRVGALMDGYLPDAVAVEDLYFGAN